MLEFGGVGMKFAPGFKPLICTVFSVSFADGGWRKILSSRLHEESRAIPPSRIMSSRYRCFNLRLRSSLREKQVAIAELHIHREWHGCRVPAPRGFFPIDLAERDCLFGLPSKLQR